MKENEDNTKKSVLDIRKKKSIERLNFILEDLGLNINQLSEKMGYTRPEKLYKVMRGENAISKNLAKEINNKFSQYSEDWLLTGEGEMLKNEIGNININGNNHNIVNSNNGNVTQSQIKNEVEAVPEENYMMVEFEDLEVSAGLLGGGEVAVLPERKTRLVPREYKKGYYLVVRVSGQSMYDGSARSISEGEELLIRQFEDTYLNLPIRTKLFVIVTNEGAVVKQIKSIDKDKKEIICHSFNPNYEDYSVNFSDILQIFLVEKKVNAKILF